MRVLSERPLWLLASVSVLSAFVVFFAVVYVPAGLAALAYHDGMTEALRVGLGVSAPLPIRIFVLLQRWTPSILAIVALLAIALALVPSRILKWLAVVVGIGGAAGVVSSLELPDPDLLPVSLALLGLLLLFTTASLLTRGWLASRAARWATLGTLLALGAMRLGADLWGRARLAEYDERWQGEVGAERERLESRERPAAFGSSLDEDAAPRYLQVLDPLSRSEPGISVCDALRGAPLQDGIAAKLDARKDDLDALHAAARCRRSTFGLDLESWAGADRPHLPTIRRAGCFLILNGRRRAQEGDIEGAAQSYLAAVRFGGDVSQGPLLHVLIGSSIEEDALASLGKLVLSHRERLPMLAEPLMRLESTRATPADGARYDRLLWGHIERTWNEHPEQLGFESRRILPWLVPYRALLSQAVWTADPLHRELEDALEALDRERVENAERALRHKARGSLNPILRTLGGESSPWDEPDDRGVAVAMQTRFLVSSTWFRLVRAALLGCNPGSAIEDPFAPGERIRCSLDERAVRFWSVGADGKDDSGLGVGEADIVLAP
jgi:hypothetical protein